MSEWLSSLLSSNPYFSAGFGLVGLTAGLAVSRRLAIISISALERHFVSSCEVTSRDAFYPLLLRWLSRHHPRHRVSLTTNVRDSLNAGQQTWHSELVPATGKFIFRHENNWIKVERVRQEAVMGGRDPFESVTMSCLGRDTSPFTSVLIAAKEEAIKLNAGFSTTYVPRGHEWREFGHPRLSRSLESVILDQGLKESLVEDVCVFIESADWYAQRGIPYRRGFLLEGPPGSGKSSFIFALAGHLNWSLSVLSLCDHSLTDDRLAHLLVEAPANSLVVIEDIDAIFPDNIQQSDANNYQQHQQSYSRLSLSGLLNTLDGLVSSEGRVLFATTNHVHKLDAALLRPGRFDVKVHIGQASDYQIRIAFQRFFPSADSQLVDMFLSNIRNNHGLKEGVSMALIQNHFMRYRDDAISAAKNQILV